MFQLLCGYFFNILLTLCAALLRDVATRYCVSELNEKSLIRIHARVGKFNISVGMRLQQIEWFLASQRFA